MSESRLRKGEREKGSEGESASPFLPFSLSPFLLFAAVFFLYRRALGFAYFNDDPGGHFAWMEGRTLLDFFAGSADYGYYRPVVFAVLRLTELLFGNDTFPHNPVADHALLLLLHAANAVLLWALVRRVSRDELFALSAALIFAFVPFSYEAVAYVASLTHPLVVFWVLLALWLYGRRSGIGDWETGRVETGRVNTGYWPLLTVLALTCLALLTHENGLFVLPALVGVDWLLRPSDSWQRRVGRLWPFAVPVVSFVVVWLLVPKGSEQGLNGLADAGRNVVPFLQTLVYPLLPIVRLDAGDVGLLVVLAAVVVGGLGGLAWRAGVWRVWVFALGWFALSSLPALLFLGPAYVYGSPRLSYLPSVAAAMLWALPVLAVARAFADRRQAARLLLSALYLAAVLLPPLPFIRCQLDFYAATTRFAWGMAEAAGDAPMGRDVVFVNAPFFFSSTAARPDGCPSPYPWTPVGGVLIPPYAQARDFVRFNGGPDRPATGVTYDGYAPGWRTFGPAIDGETLRAHAAEDAPFVFNLLDESFDDLRGAWQPGAADAAGTAATFGEALALSGATLDEEGERLTAQLAWRVVGETAEPLAAFVHIYDATGTLVAQSDGPPGDGLAPQALWRPGDGLADERRIDLSELPQGAYRVAVGVYSATSGARLSASAAGASLPDHIYTIGAIER